MSNFSRQAPAALLVLLGCAGAGASRQDLESLRAEVRALRRENEELSRRVDVLGGRVDVVAARQPRGGAAARPPDAAAATAATGPVVPPDLAVVRVAPRSAAKQAPPIPTTVPIAEPDPDRLDVLARPSRRELSVEAEAELKAARKGDGVERAHALEDFAARYPRHPSADNALVEAAAAYADAGRDEPACALAARARDDYPAGDAMSDALLRLAWCESRRGTPDAERRVLERLVADFPSTPAAERAGARLADLPRSGP